MCNNRAKTCLGIGNYNAGPSKPGAVQEILMLSFQLDMMLMLAGNFCRGSREFTQTSPLTLVSAMDMDLGTSSHEARVWEQIQKLRQSQPDALDLVAQKVIIDFSSRYSDKSEADSRGTDETP
jgi:hypothetical protein